jgi:Transglycosylase SLT domain
MNDSTLPRARTRARSALARLRPPAGARRPSLYLTVAAAGAVLVNVLGAGEPPAQADTATQSVSIARELGLDAASASVGGSVRPLEQLAATRADREAAQTAAAQAQAAADKKELEARAAAEAARRAVAEKAAQEAAARAAAEQAAEQAAAQAAQAPQVAAPAAPSSSFQDYALGKLGGDGGQFSCLENLWGKESGWNPNAQNPSSTAYGIPQFLDSTWASTGIAKTSDGYRQIDAGLIYIDNRYGSPCGAWGHSQANGWY